METPELEILTTGDGFSLRDICERSGMSAEIVIEYVEYGVLDPVGARTQQWQFTPSQLARLQRALRLQRDLDINLPGLALALDLLEELEGMRAELASLRRQLGVE